MQADSSSFGGNPRTVDAPHRGRRGSRPSRPAAANTARPRIDKTSCCLHGAVRSQEAHSTRATSPCRKVDIRYSVRGIPRHPRFLPIHRKGCADSPDSSTTISGNSVARWMASTRLPELRSVERGNRYRSAYVAKIFPNVPRSEWRQPT